MSRGKALQLGRYYHIYNRGNNRENIFLEERNYRYFLQLYAHHVHPVVDTFAYCLMRNHFHLLVKVKGETELQMSDVCDAASPETSDISTRPTRAFASFFNAYTKAMNKAYGRTGRLFQEHFGRIEVTRPEYFTNLIFYIHSNPQKHSFVSDFRDWPWSSYHALKGAAITKLRRDDVLSWFGSAAHYEKFHASVFDLSSITSLIADDLTIDLS